MSQPIGSTRLALGAIDVPAVVARNPSRLVLVSTLGLRHNKGADLNVV
jgi:hypothetical protein